MDILLGVHVENVIERDEALREHVARLAEVGQRTVLCSAKTKNNKSSE